MAEAPAAAARRAPPARRGEAARNAVCSRSRGGVRAEARGVRGEAERAAAAEVEQPGWAWRAAIASLDVSCRARF